MYWATLIVSKISSLVAPVLMVYSVNAFTPSTSPSGVSKAMAMRNLTFHRFFQKSLKDAWALDHLCLRFSFFIFCTFLHRFPLQVDWQRWGVLILGLILKALIFKFLNLSALLQPVSIPIHFFRLFQRRIFLQGWVSTFSGPDEVSLLHS